MKTIELFVYDFDGTLVNTKEDIAYSVNLSLQELGLSRLDHETIYTYIGGGVRPLMTRAVAGTGFDDVAKAVGIFKELYAEHLVERSHIYPNCRETLDFFSHKKHAILSNKPECFIRKILAKLDFLQPFVSILGGDSLDNKKPDPQGLDYLMASHGISADEALMIGDMDVDIETGKRANVLTCGVAYGFGGRSALEQADYIIDDISELKKLFN